ncbi:hypothetical protein [Spirosoma rhododendri]|uniref:Uncharacterized protein n=1 Tax=Spirosoma rhododendri TaxID=2728024 RepID=A0A7L5DJN8_9BACT|nr:hypothetical protein [Spirosoma rhododendri]QJD78659.1 hypothetical protein HH216_09640 [Spirosoma rhododendri]
MKPLFLALLLGISFAATAQTSTYSSTHSSINDTDKTLSIQINGQRNGREFAYNRTFDVRGLNKTQKEAIKNRVLDSLGLGENPPAPHRPEAAINATGEVPVTFVCPTCEGRVKLMVSGPTTITEEFDAPKNKGRFPRTLTLLPGEYQYEYWQNGVQQMRLPFTVKAGEGNEVKVK